MTRLGLTCLLLVHIGALAACGGGKSSGAAGSSAAGSSSAGSSGHSAQSTAGAGGAAGSQAASVMCGSEMCQVSAAAAVFSTACCADEASSTCGTKMGSGACVANPKNDPRCPEVDAMGFITLPSCCTKDGQCGVNSVMFGVGGCTDLATAASQGSGIGIDFPAPRACGEADAGI